MNIWNRKMSKCLRYGVLLFCNILPVYAAQFSFNVPVNAQFFRPGADINIICGLYRQDETTSSVIQARELNFDSSGQFLSVVPIEFDDVIRPYEMTHYACYTITAAAENSNFDAADGSCWSSSQGVTGIVPEECAAVRYQFLNLVNSHSTGKQSLPIQYEY